MNPAIKQRWLDALRSNRFAQGKRVLHERHPDGRETYCCLGVLCELAFEDEVCNRRLVPYEGSGDESGRFAYGLASKSESSAHLPRPVVDWAGLSDCNPVIQGLKLSNLNDSDFSFAEIAELIENYL